MPEENGIAKSQVPVVSPIIAALDANDECIATIEKQLADLTTRLTPISNGQPVSQADKDYGDAVSGSEVLNRVNANNVKLIKVSDVLTYITQTLEV